MVQTSEAALPGQARVAIPAIRWFQLAAGILCMIMIANMQYGWTVFVDPIEAKHHWGRPAIQWAFTLFVLFETWPLPFLGYLIDRFGLSVTSLVGGVMIAVAWYLNSIADTLTLLYAGAIVGGVGAGFIYAGAVGNALKWFPDRRGLAAGLTAAGFGAGSALTVAPIIDMIKNDGYEHTFLVFGLGQGAIVVLLSFLLRAPRPGELPTIARASAAKRDMTPREVLKSPLFYLMYLMFVLVGAGGLMAVAQLKPIAKDLHIDTVVVTILGLSMTAIAFALTIDRILNGLTRPFFGWVSDWFGRENTMFVAFLLEGIGILLLMKYGADPVMFVVLSGLVFFAWGEIYSLFPATMTDTYGGKFATSNYGLLYTAKGTAALIVPYGNVISEATGSWTTVFVLVAGFNFLAAILALVVLKPMRRKMLA